MKIKILLLFLCFIVSIFTYAQVNLEDGLMAHYPFCNSAIDASGNGNNGQVSGATSIEDRFCSYGAAFSFDGFNDFVQVPHSPDVNFGSYDEFTVCVWVKVVVPQLNLGSINNDIISKWHTNNDNFNFGYPYTFRLLNQTSGNPYAFYATRWHNTGGGGGCGTGAGVTYPIPLDDNEFHFLVMRRQNDSIYLFVDGNLYGVNPDTSPCSTSNQSPLRFGKRATYSSSSVSNFFRGIIDDIRIYDRAITDEEVTALYNEVPEVCCPPGDIIFNKQCQIDNFPQQCPINNNITISGDDITNLDSLGFITNIPGDLNIQNNTNLLDLSGLSNIDSIGGHIFIDNNDSLMTIPGFDSLEYLDGCIEITGNPQLTEISGFNNLTYVTGYIEISNNIMLDSITGFQSLDSLGGSITIEDNTSLIEIGGLGSITVIGGHLFLTDNTNLTSLSGFSNLASIGGCLDINNNDALLDFQWFSNLTSIDGYLSITNNDGLIDLNGLNNLLSINGDLTISNNASLITLEHLEFLSDVGITNVIIQNCPELTICVAPCICSVIFAGGNALIENNATGCDSIPQVDALCQPLPVELLDFKATLENKKVNLTWTTATEFNNDYFAIEHSTDGQNFSTIGRVEGYGTTTVLQEYNYTHENPQLGNNYYRLRQTDTDGTYEFSTIEVVKLAEFEVSSVSIRPNPTKGIFYLEYPGIIVHSITIFDTQGRQVKHFTNLSSNTSSYQIDCTDLPEGIYPIQIKTSEGIFNKKLILTR